MSQLPKDHLLAAMALVRSAHDRLQLRLLEYPTGPQAAALQAALDATDVAIAQLFIALGGPIPPRE